MFVCLLFVCFLRGGGGQISIIYLDVIYVSIASTMLQNRLNTVTLQPSFKEEGKLVYFPALHCQ